MSWSAGRRTHPGANGCRNDVREDVAIIEITNAQLTVPVAPRHVQRSVLQDHQGVMHDANIHHGLQGHALPLLNRRVVTESKLAGIVRALYVENSIHVDDRARVIAGCHACGSPFHEIATADIHET